MGQRRLDARADRHGARGEQPAQVHVAIAASGVATVAWYYQLAPISGVIAVRRANADSTLGAEVDTALSASSGGDSLSAVALPSGATLLDSGAVIDVVSAAGVAAAPVDLHTSGAVSTLGAAVAFDAQGDGVVAWRRGLANPFAVVARRVGPSGAPLGPEIVVQPDTNDFVGAYQGAAVNSSGHFLVTWSLQDNGNFGHAYVRAVNPDGSLPDTAHAVSGDSEPPPGALVALDDAGTGIAETDFLAPQNNTDVPAAQLLSATGSPVGGPVDLNGTGAGRSSALANDPASGVATDVFSAPFGPQLVAMANRFLEPPSCAASSVTGVTGRSVAVHPVCGGVGINGYRILSGPSHGVLSVTGTSVTFTPKPGFPGSDGFTFEAVNGGGTSGAATVTVSGDSAPRVVSFKLRHRHGRFAFVLGFSKPSTVSVRIGVLFFNTHHPSRSATVKVSRAFVVRLARKGRVRATATATDPLGMASLARTIKVRF